MAYLVLARKYRPVDFDSVVYQEHVTTTLKNAISLERVAHAHIFTGPRGTGKTSIARILAKCMNCENGPTSNPCGNCRSCLEIIKGRTSDIIEIDGASNNNVEQIREIRDNLQYKPSYSKYKIYIIDEVHMLSIAAFNALLKSLEEPPPHIMFFFATTEPHKVPVTIMSRCQRHDLKRVPLNFLVNHLINICELESIKTSNEAIAEIASAGEGSVRDSISLLDQLISSSSTNEVSTEQIRRILGTPSFSIAKNTIEALFLRNRELIAATINDLYFSGVDLKIFYQKTIEYLRHIILINLSPKSADLSDLPDNYKAELANISSGFEISYFIRLLDLLLKEEIRVRQTENIRILLEIIFFKLCEIPESKEIESLISTLENLKNKEPKEKFQVLEKKPETPIRQSHKIKTINEKTEEPGFVSEKKPMPETKPINTLSDKEKWVLCIKQLKKENPSGGTLFENSSDFVSKKENTLEIRAKGTNYHIQRIQKEKDLVEKISSKIFDENISLKIIEDHIKNNPESKKNYEDEKVLSFAKTDLLVKEIEDKLNGKIISEKIADKHKNNIFMEDN
ncbi:MAG: DNA polymerase III subunit gamma/tau [Desulforegulaceae bacterium]|nr:DNA polymerase III subunit gamma/tau [Desulforegulaceae bacterium]